MYKLDIERGTIRIILDNGKVHELLCRNVTWCTSGNRCTLFNTENGRTVFTCDCHEVFIRDIETGEWLAFNTGQEWSDAMQNFCVGLEDVNVQSISDRAAKMIAEKVGDQWEIKEDGIGAKQIADDAIDTREIKKHTFIPDHYTDEYWDRVREAVDIIKEDAPDESTIKVTAKHIDGEINPKTSGVVDPGNPPAADIDNAKQDIRNSADRIQVGVDNEGNPVYNYIRVWADKASLDDLKGDYLGTKTDAGEILTLAKRQVRESVDIFNEDTDSEKSIKVTAKHISGELTGTAAEAGYLTDAKKEIREALDIVDMNDDGVDEKTLRVTTRHIDGEMKPDGPTLAKKDIRESVNKYDTGEVDDEGNPIYDYIHVCVDAMEFNKVDTISIDGEGMPDPADPTKELKPAKKSIREAVDILDEDTDDESTIKVSTKHVLENAIVAESFTEKSITTNAIDEACFVPDQFSGYDQMEHIDEFTDMPAFIRKCVDAVPTDVPGEFNYIKVAVADSVPSDVKHFTTQEEAEAQGIVADALDQIREAVDIIDEGLTSESTITVSTKHVLPDAIISDSFSDESITARAFEDEALEARVFEGYNDANYTKASIDGVPEMIRASVDAISDPSKVGGLDYIKVEAAKVAPTTPYHYLTEEEAAAAGLTLDYPVDALEQVRTAVDIENEGASNESTIKVTAKHIDGTVTGTLVDHSQFTDAKKDIRDAVDVLNKGMANESMITTAVGKLDGEIVGALADHSNMTLVKKDIRDCVDIINENLSNEKTIKVSTKHVLEDAIIADSFSDASIKRVAFDGSIITNRDALSEVPALMREALDVMPTSATDATPDYIKVEAAKISPTTPYHFITETEAAAYDLDYDADALDQIREAVDIKNEGTATEECIKVYTKKVLPEAIKQTSFEDGSIDNAALNDDAIDDRVIKDAAITADKIAAEAITNEKFAADAIDADVIAEKSFTEPKFGDGAISDRVLADGLITEPKFDDAAISNRAFADAAIDADVLADETITRDKFAADAIDVDVIKDGLITNPKFADDAIDDRVIKDATIKNAKFDDDAIDVRVIKDATITADKFAVAAITKDVVDQCVDITVASDKGLIDKNFNKSFYDAIKTLVDLALEEKGLATWFGTQDEYDALPEINPGVTYYIYE